MPSFFYQYISIYINEKVFLVIITAFLFPISAYAATTVQHSNGTFDSGYTFSNFNSAEFNVGSITADTLTISNIASSSYAHDHYGPVGVDVNIDIMTGGTWNNIFNLNIFPASGANYLTTIFANPITFGQQTFTKFRLTSNPFQSQIFHGVSGNMTYNFDTVSTVPVPAAVWLMGSGLLGVMGFARKNKAQVTA